MKAVWASIDEKGNITGGKPGDQNRKEVKEGAYYDFGQTHYIRFKSRNRAKRAVNIARYLATNPHVGYCQATRDSLHEALKMSGWDCTKLFTNVNTDCSAFITSIINCAYEKEKVPPYYNSWAYVAGDVSKRCPKGLTSPKKLDTNVKLKLGDIVCKRGHVVIITEE